MFEKFSKHALERTSQRNIRGENIEFLLRFGRKIHRAGALFVFQGRAEEKYGSGTMSCEPLRYGLFWRD